MELKNLLGQWSHLLSQWSRLAARKSSTLIGLDVTSHSIKMVELSVDNEGEFSLRGYVQEPVSESIFDANDNILDIELTGEAIRRAWKRLGTNNRRVAMALSTKSVVIKRVFMPADLNDYALELQIEGESGQYLPFPLDEVYLDFNVLGRYKGSDMSREVEVLLAAARREKIDDFRAVIEVAGLQLEAVDIEHYAMEGSFFPIRKAFSFSDNHVSVLIDIGASTTSFLAVHNNEIVYSREYNLGGNTLTQDIQRHYNLSYEDAEKSKCNNSLGDIYQRQLLAPFLENIALEITRALRVFHSSTHFAAVHHIVLSGGSAIIPGLEKVVASRTNIPTTLANPFVGITVKNNNSQSQLLNDAPGLMTACGLALQHCGMQNG